MSTTEVTKLTNQTYHTSVKEVPYAEINHTPYPFITATMLNSPMYHEIINLLGCFNDVGLRLNNHIMMLTSDVIGNVGLYVAYYSGFFTRNCSINKKIAYFAVFYAGHWECDNRSGYRFEVPTVDEVLTVWKEVSRRYKKKQPLKTKVQLESGKFINQSVNLNFKGYTQIRTVGFRTSHDLELDQFISARINDIPKIGVCSEYLSTDIATLYLVPKNVTVFIVDCIDGRYTVSSINRGRMTRIESDLTEEGFNALMGKKFHSIQGRYTFTPGTSNKRAGNSDRWVTGDGFADNIKREVTIFGVTGTYTG